MKLRKTYNFRTLAPSILGVGYRNAKLTAIVDYEEAIRRDTVDHRFKTIFPVLDPKPVNDPTIYNYYVFSTEQGSSVVLCEAWIDQASIVEVTGENYRISIRNTDSTTINKVRAALVALKVSDFEIETY